MKASSSFYIVKHVWNSTLHIFPIMHHLGRQKIAAFDRDLSPQASLCVSRSEKSLHLAAAVFLCICNGLQLRFICAQKFQGTSLFLWTAKEWVQLGFISRSLLPNFSTAFSPPPIPISRPHSRSWWPINLSTTNGSVAKICEQRFGSWFAKFLACHLFNAKGLRLAPYKAELAN